MPLQRVQELMAEIKMKEKGYTVQSPVAKEKSDKGEEKEEPK
jgi:hypothetical protein